MGPKSTSKHLRGIDYVPCQSAAGTLVYSAPDADGDGIPDYLEPEGDLDEDDLDNWLDPDADGDGVLTKDDLTWGYDPWKVYPHWC